MLDTPINHNHFQLINLSMSTIVYLAIKDKIFIIQIEY